MHANRIIKATYKRVMYSCNKRYTIKPFPLFQLVTKHSFHFHSISTFFLIYLFLAPNIVVAQNDGPCCAQRWNKGQSWGEDGTVTTTGSSQGIVKCGNSAETQSNTKTNCVYQASSFPIDLNGIPCVDPGVGGTTSVTNPTNGADIIWMNFDIRPYANNYQFQLNNGGKNNDNLGWALYYSNSPTSSVGSDGLSGDCNDLTYVDCGVGFTGWAMYQTPEFSEPTNLYLAIWNQDGGNWKKGLNIFKARFGCGVEDEILCSVETGETTTTCNNDGTYTVNIPIAGVNGTFAATDIQTGMTSDAVCLTNLNANTLVVSDTIRMVYPIGTDYNISIAPNLSGNDNCAIPENPSDCVLSVSGTSIPENECTDPTAPELGGLCPGDFFIATENIGLASSGDNWAASWGDYNGDGHVDLFITTHDLNSPNELFRNNGNGTFSKVTTGPIATDMASSLAASWADYDNDQDLDLVVANNIGTTNFLYRNEGGGNFTRMQNDPIVTDLGYAHGISWVDYNKDGFLDLFVASFFSTQFNLLYHNNGDGTFSKEKINAITREARSSTCGVWADYNNDGLIDLFVANTNGENNSLYENKGNGKFLKINSGAIVNDGGHSVGGSWADYDNDGDVDLFVANASDEDNFLYRNDGNGNFTKITEGVVVNDNGHSHGSGWADFDNDGWIDLFVANDQSQNNVLYKNAKDGSFIKIENSITQNEGESFGVAWADYDNDGGVDLFVSNRAGNENFLYQNNKAICNGKICISLVGSNSNKSAIGAKIFVTATISGQEVTQMREITAQSGGGIGGQNELKAIFGLGNAGTVDEIKVLWPSGYEQVLVNQIVDDCIVITEENASMVFGVVYFDENENCIQDNGELGIANQKVSLVPGGHVVYTDENGIYKAYVPVQNYDIVPEAGNNWTLSCQAQSAQRVDVPSIGGEFGEFNFGITATCASPDLSVEVASTAHRIGFQNLISLTFKNEGTIAANNATLSLQLDPYVLAVESTIPWDDQIGQSLIWNIASLPAGASQTIYLTDSIAANTPIGQEIVLNAKINGNEGDCNGADNDFTNAEFAIGALDPNDILVHPEGAIKKDEVLTYKIRFQNIGNIPVANVRVTSTLPEELDKYTFELGVGSHAFRFEQEGNDLTWEFPNIMLPDSVNNEPESHGFVTFRIVPKVGMPIGTIIENKAKIFFDNMEPIVTNTVQNIIQPKITRAQFDGHLYVYPNPTNGFVNIQLLSDNLDKPDDIRIIQLYNTQGVLVKSLHNLSEGILVDWDLESLPTGLYYLQAVDQKGDGYSGKIMVQK